MPEAVTILAVVEPGDEREIPLWVADAAAQEGVAARLILADATPTGSAGAAAAALDGPVPVDVVRGPRQRERLLLDALAHTRDPLIALAVPGCRSHPTRLAQAAAALGAEVDAVTCDYFLTDGEGRPVDRSSPAAMGEAPGPFWEAGLVCRREAFATLREEAFTPVELELWRRLRAAGRVGHVLEPGFHASRESYLGALERSVEDAALVTLRRRGPGSGVPRWTVCLSPAGSAADLCSSLRALCRQRVAAGTFECVVAGPEGDGDEVRSLRELRWPFPLRWIDVPPGTGRPAARRACVEAARGERVLLLDAGTLAEPDLLACHRRAHGRIGGGGVLVQGPVQPAPHLQRSALQRHLASAALRLDNLSARAADLRRVAGFDAVLEPGNRAELERWARNLGLELESAPRARATRVVAEELGALRRRALEFGRDAVLAALRGEDRDAPAGSFRTTLTSCEAAVAATAERRRILEEALGELARMDVAALEELGGEWALLAREVVRQLDERLPELTRLWRLGGLPAGLRAGGASCTPAGMDDPTGLAGRDVPPPPARRAPAVAPAPPELSVIVPTRDRPQALAGLLESLAAQDLEPERFEVLVVDDGSLQPAAEGVQPDAFPFALRLLRQAPAGPGAARNRALAEARGEVVLFLNDDAVPAEGALRRHLDRQLHAEAEVAVLGTFALLPRHRVHSLAEHVETSTALFGQPRMRPGVLYDGLSLSTGNVSLPRRAVEAVGGFDESFPYPGGEDSELGLRLERERGIRVLYDPAIRCGHDHALDVHGLVRRRRIVGWAAQRMQAKHGDLGLLPLPRWPPSAGDWRDLARGVQLASGECAGLEESVAQLCAREVELQRGPVAVERVRSLLERLDEHAFLLGAVLAAQGLSPDAVSRAPLPA